MREIKFRGKRLDNGEWVYGYYFQAEGRHFILPQTKYSPLWIGDNCEHVTEFIGVDPATVGQFTGQKDRAGKEIWERDVVSAFNGKYIGEVVYVAPEFVVQNLKESRLNFFEQMPNGDLNFGIIGNIHDNPELLEVPS